ncbi:MAG: alkylphosphonate utilization protein [Massilia sp.]|jgi:protein PhnA|nr:alkylphosphonate utilization protein [Massilia sp.]
MTALPPCPACHSTYTYADGSTLTCPECGHEWSAQSGATQSGGHAAETARVYRDAAGKLLQDGDTVTVIKDLKPKGSGGVIKQGTKVRNIRLVDGDHDIDCKIDGFGAMSLKSEFVRKV